MEKKAKGKNFLLVTSIILIVLAVFSILGVVINFGTLAVMSGEDTEVAIQLEQQLALQGVTMDVLKISMAFAAVTAVVYLVAGIVGIKNHRKPEKAQSSFIMGIVMLVILFINCVYSALQGSFVIWSIAINAVLLLLYLWGAILNKESSQG